MEKTNIMTEKEFDNQIYGGNWMRPNAKGIYNNLPFERYILTNCKSHKGDISSEPFVAIDNTKGLCEIDSFKTKEEAINWLENLSN